MSAARFLIVAGPEEELASAFDTLRRKLPHDWVNAWSGQGVRVLAHPGTPIVTVEGQPALVLGALFDPAGQRIMRLGASSGTRLATSRGQSLIKDHWGRYVGLIASREVLRILRDPSASVPVYLTRKGRLHVAFSDVEDALLSGLVEGELDPCFMTNWLTFPYLRSGRTGLSGVTELHPGGAVDLAPGGTPQIQTLWSPWDHANDSARVQIREKAVEDVGHAVAMTVAAQARHSGRILLELSGGLDSSLIATCLAAAGQAFDGINLATEADGDERGYARLVAAAAGVDLAEQIVSAGDGGLEIPSRRLRPGVDPALRVLDCAFSEQAAAVEATTLFSGTGGDNIFCYTKSAGPVLDALHDRGLRQAWSTAHDVADLCEVTLWAVARAALRRWRRKPTLWPSNLDFLPADCVSDEPEPHPWLPAPSDIPPGKRDHVAALLRIQHFLDTPERTHRWPVIYPLLSQPVIEACLRTPTWMWVAGGRNRAVVRDAFAADLPPAILKRMGKGRLRSFCHRSFVRNRARIAELLLDGTLVRRGVIDGIAVEAYLTRPGDPPDDRYFRISDLANLELWARSWGA